ncbi:MAG: carbohydrate kinase [Clostridia bacterium]|nr:carbohydrate kinase [Clostridia bacterium]
MIDVVALGELLIDFTCQSVSDEGYPTMSAHPGGAPANFLSALASCGAKTAFIGKVGNDSFGRTLTNTLNKAGIETKGLIMAEDVFTTLAFVTVDGTGNREFSFARKPGADTTLTFDEIDFSLIDEAKVFHFGTLSLTDEPARTATVKAVEYAQKQGKLITYDPNLRPPLWKSLEDARKQILWGLTKADIVKISDNEIECLFGLSPEDGASYIIENYDVKLVFVTCGADGCYFETATVKGHVSALENLKVVDTTGAGDIFGGFALWGVLENNKKPEELQYEELYSITRFACVAAGLSTQKQGGISSIPSMKEINQFY